MMKKRKNIFFFQNLNIIDDSEFGLKNLLTIGEDKVFVNSDGKALFYQLKEDKIDIILRVDKDDIIHYYDLCDFVYKSKFLICIKNFFKYLAIFSLEKRQFICNTSSPDIDYIIQIFPLINGHLLVVYTTESWSSSDKKNYNLIEAVIFEKKIFVIKKFDFKVHSIVAQLKDGTIIYNIY